MWAKGYRAEGIIIAYWAALPQSWDGWSKLPEDVTIHAAVLGPNGQLQKDWDTGVQLATVQHLKNIIQHTEEKIQRISVEYNALKNRVAQNQRLQDLTNQITAERTKLQAAKERESARDQAIQKIANLKKKKRYIGFTS